MEESECSEDLTEATAQDAPHQRIFGPDQIVQMNESLLESAITLYLKKGYDKRFLPIKAKHHRSWWEADSKTRMHARFCLPLKMASGLGFYILSPATFTVEWDGDDKHDANIEIIDACDHATIDNHSAFGSFTVQSSFIARTKRLGDFVYIKGIANSARLPYSVLEAMIESWWSPSEFGIVCLLNQPGKFTIKKGDALAQMIVVNSEQALYDLTCKDGYPPIWSEWIVKQANPEKNLDYFRGRLPDGTQVCPHFTSWSDAILLDQDDERISIDDFIQSSVEAEENQSYEDALRHLERALHLAEARKEVSERLIDVTHDFAMNKLANLPPDLRITLLHKCITLHEREFASELAARAKLHEHLAYVYSTQNNATAASAQYENSLKLQKESQNDRVALATTLMDYGSMCNYTGDFERAAKLFSEAEHNLHDVLPQEDQRQLFLKNSMAILFTDQGKFEEAAQLYEDLIQTRSRIFGTTSLELASTLNDFAFHYKLRGDFKKAEELFKQCLAIRVETLGADDLEVADAHEQLHWVYKDDGNFKGALASLKLAIEVRLKMLPPDSDVVKTNYQLLSDIYTQLDEPKLASEAAFNAKR